MESTAKKSGAWKGVLLFMVLVALVLVFLGNKNKEVNDDVVLDDNQNTPISLCFFKKEIPTDPSSGKYTLRLNLNGDKVDGELKFLPKEKDSKVGKFEGLVSPVDKTMMARAVSATWDTFAEGMNTKEELNIIFGEGNASIGMGEMKDRGDGVYVYANPEKILYNLDLTDVDCAILDNV